MIYIMTVCIGMTWGMCHQHVKQEFTTMAACYEEREYQQKHTKDIIWIKCEELPKHKAQPHDD